MIVQKIDNSSLVTLPSQIGPASKAQDEGPIAADRQMILQLVLKRSPEQQAALDIFNEETQTAGTLLYRQSLTPAEFGDTFGLADADMKKIGDWLAAQGFQAIRSDAARNVITFQGTAAAIESAFHTDIHLYQPADGPVRYSNTGDIKIPAALAPVVRRILGLENFSIARAVGYDGAVSASPTSQAIHDPVSAVEQGTGRNPGWFTPNPSAMVTRLVNGKDHPLAGASTTTTVSAGTTAVVFAAGTTVTLTNEVTWAAAGTPTGTLTLSDVDGTLNASINLSSCTLSTATEYTCTYNWTTATGAAFTSPDSITATYSGDATYASSTGTSSITISYQYGTSGFGALYDDSFTATPNSATEGTSTPVSITTALYGFTVDGIPVPAGKLFLWGSGSAGAIETLANVNTCSSVSDPDGSGNKGRQCSYTWNTPTTLSPGSITLYGDYGGNADYPSYEFVEPFTIKGSGTAPTTTAVTDNPIRVYTTARGTTFTSVTSWTGSGTAPTGNMVITAPSGDLFGDGTAGGAVFPVPPATSSSGSGTYSFGTYTYTYSCTTSVSAKTVTCVISDSDMYTAFFTGPGTYTMSATYSGDTTYAGSTGTTTLYVTNGATTYNALTPTPASVALGSGTTINYSVVVNEEYTTRPTGTITLSGTPIAGSPVVVNTTSCTYSTTYGSLNCTIPAVVPVATPVGSYTVSAFYSGDANYNASTGTNAVSVTGAVPTTTTATANPAAVALGANTTVTSVTTWTGNGATPTGTVALSCGAGSGGVCINLPAPVNVNTCTISTSSKTITCSITYALGRYGTDYGGYTLVMSYSGDATYAGSQGTVQASLGGGTTSSETVSAGASPSTTYGAGPTESFTIKVKGAAGYVPATGAVVAANSTLGTLATAAVSTTCTTTGSGNNKIYTCPAAGTYSVPVATPAGSYPIVFTYSGDSTYLGSTTSTTLTIAKAASTDAASNVSGAFESTVTLSATTTGVTGAAAPSEAPTFTVNGLSVTGAPSCTSSGAVETCTLSYTLPASLAGGSTYPIVATFAGDSNYNAPAAAASATLTVTASATPTLTFTSVSHNFGQVAVGTAAASYGIQITNSGTAAYPFALVFTAASGFTSATNCGTSIAVGAKCELVFYFTPAATGPVSATWSLTPVNGVVYGPSNGGLLQGSGTSAGGVTLTTNGHNFGVLANGTQSPTYGTELSNSTSAAVTLTLGSVSAPFTAITNCGPTLAAGASCELEFYATGNSATTTTTQVYTLSASTPITSGGAALPNGGITLTGN